MSISEQLRKAALGRAPKYPRSLWQWLGIGEAYYFAYTPDLSANWWDATNDTRRTFLLFLAETLK